MPARKPPFASVPKAPPAKVASRNPVGSVGIGSRAQTSPAFATQKPGKAPAFNQPARQAVKKAGSAINNRPRNI